jgi:hypothetical protein
MRATDPVLPLEGADLDARAPALHDGREGDERHRLAEDDPREDAPLGDAPPLHHEREPDPHDDADEPSGRRDAECRERGERDDEPERLRRGRAGDGLGETHDHVPDVRHGEVGRAGEDAGVADHDAVVRSDELVALPDEHDGDDAGDAPCNLRQHRRSSGAARSATRIETTRVGSRYAPAFGGRYSITGHRHAFAGTCSESSGITVSP